VKIEFSIELSNFAIRSLIESIIREVSVGSFLGYHHYNRCYFTFIVVAVLAMHFYENVYLKASERYSLPFILDLLLIISHVARCIKIFWHWRQTKENGSDISSGCLDLMRLFLF